MALSSYDEGLLHLAGKIGQVSRTSATLVANRTRNLTPLGVNLAGMDFGEHVSQLPGQLGTDYFMETDAQLAMLARRGITEVRLPFRQERLATIDGTLRTTQLAELRAYLDRIYQAGITVNLDCHNYARYKAAGGPTDGHIVGSTAYPVSAFAAFWSNLVAALKDHPAIATWGLMNEPHDIPAGQWASTGNLSGAGTLANWSVQHWGSTATGATITQSTTQHGTAGSVQAFANLTAGTGVSQVIELVGNRDLSSSDSGFWVRATGSGTNATNLVAHLVFQDSSGTYFHGDQYVGITPDTWTFVTGSFRSIPTANQAVRVGVVIEASVPASGRMTTLVDMQPQSGTSMSSAKVWESVAQTVADAIYAKDQTRFIEVPVYDWSALDGVAARHPGGPFITGPVAERVVYGVHHYADGPGTFVKNWATVDAEAKARQKPAGGAYSGAIEYSVDLIDKAVKWAAGRPLVLSEVGIPASTDSASWVAWLDALLAACKGKGVGVFQWAAGSKWPANANGTQMVSVAGNTVTWWPSSVPLDKALRSSGGSGAKGDPGAPGARGDKGDPGASGAKGDKGDPGITGVQANTLAAGSQATATLNAGVLTIGVPKGADGSEGSGTDTGTLISTADLLAAYNTAYGA